MAVRKFWGQTVNFKFTVRNSGGVGGTIVANCALGVQNVLGRWTTEPGLTNETSVYIQAGSSHNFNVGVSIPVGTQVKGYGARVVIVDPETNMEHGDEVIGEAVTILSNRPVWQLSAFETA